MEQSTFSLICVLSSNGSIVFEHASYRLRKGDLYCIPSCISYRLNTEKEDQICCEKNLENRMGLDSVLQFQDIPMELYRLVSVFHSIQDSQSKQKEDILFGLRLAIHQFLLQLINRQPTEEIAFLKRELDSHAADPSFHLSDAVSKIPLSESQIRRLFKNSYLLSPLTYLNLQRLDRAKSLLLASSLPVNRIAHESGFDNPKYFSRLFRAQTGCTPSEYRKEFITSSFIANI